MKPCLLARSNNRTVDNADVWVMEHTRCVWPI